MKIYTRTGDDGNTQLLGGQKARKNDVRIVACGTIDELNAVFGMVASSDIPDVLTGQIAAVQADLFKVGCSIASAGAETKMELPTLTAEDVSRLENQIDEMESQLSELRNFLLPGGAPRAAALHLARAICRRGERCLVDLVDAYSDFEHRVPFQFLNRLSDWCFVAARFVNHSEEREEPVWHGH